jgi:hypothetical protein
LNDDKEFQFVDGMWVYLKKGQHENIDDINKIVKKSQKLEEENTAVNMKMDIMLDLLAELMTENETLKAKN